MTFKYIIQNLRNIYNKSMMWPALAGNIIHLINSYRKLYLSSYFFFILIIGLTNIILSSYSLKWSDIINNFPLYNNLFRALEIPYGLLFGIASTISNSEFENHSQIADRIEKFKDNGPRVAAYLRVSTSKQAKEGVSLEVQHDEIVEMKKRLKPSIIYWFTDAGKTGTSFDKRKVRKIQRLAESGFIDELWVTQIDRIGREFSKLIIFCLNLCEDGVKIRTPSKIFQLSDLTDSLTLFIKAHGAEEQNRERAKRASASKARNFKMKQWNRRIPKGYKKENEWIEKSQGWGQVIEDVYQLFMTSRKISKVCREINHKYRYFLKERKLSKHHIKRFLSDPVYIGKPEYMGLTVEDKSLQYIDGESFSKAKKMLKSNEKKHKSKGDGGLREYVEKYGISALAFLDEVDYRHRACGGILVRNGTRIYNGIKRYTFLCKKCRSQFLIPTKKQLKKIEIQMFKYNSSNPVSHDSTYSKKKYAIDKTMYINKVKLDDYFGRS